MGCWRSFRLTLARTSEVAAMIALGYAALAIGCALRFERRGVDRPATTPPVTLLVPLHGLEFSLERNLRAFAAQAYPEYQLVLGVARDSDPALALARRVQAASPARIDVAVGFDASARNPKLANVLSMMRFARHDVLVLADSDTLVDRAYLRTVTAPLHDPAVGAVTALFCGAPDEGFASRLGAMFMNEQFIPAALVERLIGGRMRHCFGPTNAFRAETLRAIGGFEALAPHLADDFMLGNFVAARGLRVVLSSYVVRTTISEPNVAALFTHELRWHRTIRGVAPLGYAGMVLTYPLPLALVALLLGRVRARRGWLLVATAFAARVVLQRVSARALAVEPASPWMILPRDVFGFAVWLRGLVGSTVRWRDNELRIREGDVLAAGPAATV